ncbi:MAG TPA: methyltransferase domain-containing protein [Polyangiaceae bacterium]|nr:methyltransferase domain-containing protein [Polyangiaceae bacterium]
MPANTPSRFWDRHAAKYAEKPVPDEHAYQQTLERVRAHLSPSDRVLELGCGTGSTALALAASAGEILATDYSEQMIAIARAKARSQGVANVRFQQCSADDPALIPASFDVVMAMNLLHLLRDHSAQLRRIHDLVRPGGLFISKTPCIGDQGVGLRVVIPVLRAFGLAPHVSFVTERSLTTLITSSGFSIRETGMYPSKTRSFFVVAQRAAESAMNAPVIPCR